MYDNRKKYRPYFLAAVSVAQVVILVVNIIVGGGFEDPAKNPMLGPSAISLVEVNIRIFTCQLIVASLEQTITILHELCTSGGG